jgi:hypothetical protein
MVQHDAAFTDQAGQPPNQPASGNGGISPRLPDFRACRKSPRPGSSNA